MDLKTYWKSLNHEQREKFASRCASTVGHIQNVMYGLRSCSAELAVALERESDAALDCEQEAPGFAWVRVPDITWPSPKGKPLVDHSTEAEAR
jgi:hypothetical protein